MKQLKDQSKKTTRNTTTTTVKLVQASNNKTAPAREQLTSATYHNIGRRYSFDDNGGGYKGL